MQLGDHAMARRPKSRRWFIRSTRRRGQGLPAAKRARYRPWNGSLPGPSIRAPFRQASARLRMNEIGLRALGMQTSGMYKYDTYDQAIVDARVDEFRDQVARRLAGQITEDQFKPLQADERPLSPAPRLYAARRDPLRDAGRAADADARRTSRASTTAATATSPRGRTSSITGSSWRTRPTSSPIWRRSRCTRSRPAATASATSRPTSSRAPPPTRSPIRGPGPNCSASGAPSTPNSATCRASSRSRSSPATRTAPRCGCTISASSW